MAQVKVTITATFDSKYEIDGKVAAEGNLLAADLKVLFAEHGVTEVDSRLGNDSNLYGDLADGVYPVAEWLEWVESIE